MNKTNWIFLFIIITGMPACTISEKELTEADIELIRSINTFTEQEEVWAQNVAAQNKQASYAALDSMHLILDSLNLENLHKIHQADSIYALSLENTFRMFGYILDSIYTSSTKIAFAADKNYTFVDEKQLYADLQKADSMMHHHRQEIKRKREIFRQNFKPQTHSLP